MPQPGMNGMEPAFGEAYGGHRGLLSPYPLAMSPLGGRTEYDQSVLLMLGSPATPRKRPFELLSDLVDDGAGFGEDLHPPERWDVSALDEMTRYTKLGLVGLVGGEPPGPASASGEEETTVLLGRWGRSPWEEEQEEEEEERTRRTRSQAALQQPRLQQQQQQPAEGGVGVGGGGGGGQLLTSVASSERASVFGEEEKGASGGTGAGGQVAGAMRRGHMVEVYQVAAQEEEEAAAAAAEAAAAAAAALAAAARAAGGGGAPPQGLALEHCSTEEHNYSLCQGGESGAVSSHDAEEEEEVEEGQAEVVVPPRHKDGDKKESLPCRKAAAAEMGEEKELEEDEVEEEDEEDEEEQDEDEEGEGEEGAEETTVEAEDSSSSETEGEVEAEPAKRPGERPQKRRCFWEYRRARESAAKKKLGGGGGGGGEVRWSLSWSSSTLPSTLYRREGKKGRRKARKTDASDLTPNPQKLHNIGEQLQKLNAAIDGMGPVNDLPAVARARSRKEKNKLASRACRLKKKAQHEANKIKLWGLNQEYENLLGALLRIKEVIRRRVESSEEEDTDERGMTQRLEDILKDSSGPLVAGRTKDFVQRILAASAAGGQSNNKGKETTAQGEEDEEAG